MGFLGLLALVLVGLVFLKWFLKSVNYWCYELKLGDKRYDLPPGDMGWPFIGNMWQFLTAFKSTDPESFISTFVHRFGSTGLYKVFMFGNPSIIATSPEACRKVLMDDDAFRPGWPAATVNLIGRRSFVGIYDEEHKWLRKITATPVNGHEALEVYLKYIEDIVVKALEKWEGMERIEFLTELRRLTFNIIMHIFLSTETEDVLEAMEREYTAMNYGVRAMAINLPGFVYHRALKSRRNLVEILQSVVTRRQELRRKNVANQKRDMMDALLDVEDDRGKKLSDEDIIDILIMYLNAGHESSGHTTMWAAVFLQNHPDVFEKAKLWLHQTLLEAEQEEILRNRPTGQKGLTLKEVRRMEYLSKVIDETLRVVSFSLMVFREAKKDVNVCGYTIPKGWKVLVWFRSVHYDPQTYPEPKNFDPSRWDGFTPKAGQFLPFGAGSRLCPGNDLAKLETSIFLHHFLLKYKFEQHNPRSPVMYLPHTRPADNCVGRITRVAA